MPPVLPGLRAGLAALLLALVWLAPAHAQPAKEDIWGKGNDISNAQGRNAPPPRRTGLEELCVHPITAPPNQPNPCAGRPTLTRAQAHRRCAEMGGASDPARPAPWSVQCTFDTGPQRSQQNPTFMMSGPEPGQHRIGPPVNARQQGNAPQSGTTPSEPAMNYPHAAHCMTFLAPDATRPNEQRLRNNCNYTVHYAFCSVDIAPDTLDFRCRNSGTAEKPSHARGGGMLGPGDTVHLGGSRGLLRGGACQSPGKPRLVEISGTTGRFVCE